jgi:uncharacterized membrane protein
MFEDEEDTDRAVVPAGDWTQYELLRGFAALQRVHVRARRTAAGATEYLTTDCTASSVLELRDALLAAGVKLGLGAALAFAQSARLGYSGPIGRAGGWLYLPAVGLCLALLALDFGWWAAAIFVIVGLAVGALNGAFIRRSGTPGGLLAVQPVLVGAFVLATVAGWAVRYAL